ncbi:MAG: response regulator [Chloroflexaceae bacterium]|nr:response regulator [Chloroflexaceae bacterium]
MKRQTRIFLMQASPPHANSLQQMLAEEGYVVEFSTNGYTGWHQVCAHPPDLVLLDVELDDLDGIQVLMRLKRGRTTCRIPVVMLTSQTWRRAWNLAFKLGADLCICRDDFLFRRDGRHILCDIVDRLAVHPVEVEQVYATLSETSVDCGDMFQTIANPHHVATLQRGGRMTMQPVQPKELLRARELG